MKKWVGKWTMGTFEITEDVDGTYNAVIINYATTSMNDHIWFDTLRKTKMYIRREYGEITEIIENEIL